MTAMQCPEAEELMGAYVLDALPEDEARRMQEHLQGCAEHAAAAAELQQTQSLLALTVEEAEPSPELRRRIMRAVSIPAPPPATRAVAPPVPVARPRRGPSAPRWELRPAYLAIAAALLLALGAGWLIGYRLNQGAQPVAYLFAGDAQKAPGAEARLVYFKDRRQAILAVNGLPPLTPGHVYEVWLIKDLVPVDEGISADASGKIAVQMSADVTQYQELAITIEPGEQRLPTTTPVLIGHLDAGARS